MSDIHSTNYIDEAKRFVEANGGQTFFATQVKLRRWRVEQITPRQFKAWIAYFRSIGYPVQLFLERGYVTTPCEWPHQFDPRRSEESDERAWNFLREAA